MSRTIVGGANEDTLSGVLGRAAAYRCSRDLLGGRFSSACPGPGWPGGVTGAPSAPEPGGESFPLVPVSQVSHTRVLRRSHQGAGRVAAAFAWSDPRAAGVSPPISTQRRPARAEDNFYLEHLDKAIALLLKHDLAVVLDLHDENKTGPEKDPAYQKTLITLWGALAGHWKKTDPERVFFELLNEPAFLKNPQGWLPLQEKLAAVVRRQAPNHTIVATWPYFSAVSGFSQIQPLKDKNVVYTFHVYDPFFFTHQGAGWTPDATVAQLRSVPYPGEMPRCQGALGQAKTPWVKETLRSYCRFGWNAEKMKNHVGRAAAWGKKHGVPLWVGEFGVYPPHAPREDLLMLYRDARSAFEAHGLGWALWAYDEGFGLDRKMLPDGSFQIDEGVAGIIKE